ncbi:MAG: amino acid ABC transporter substrate-binding protein [Desulfobacterales bacterium]|nr:amino acid ABC transporter substrate-binding protein [Desulfobacterales bacterium]
MLFKNKITIFLLIVSFFPFSTKAELKIYTEEFPPFNYTENGKLKGFSVEIVKRIIKKEGLKTKIIMTSWARCLQYLNNSQKPVAVFTMAMNEVRRPLYKWVGPIKSTNIVAFSLKKSGHKFKNINEIKKSGLIVGICNKCNSYDILLKMRFPKNSIDGTYNMGDLVKKLYYGRIPVVVFEENAFEKITRSLNYSMDKLNKLFVFKTKTTWIAFSKNTPNSVVERWQKAFDNISIDDKNKIFSKYLNN